MPAPRDEDPAGVSTAVEQFEMPLTRIGSIVEQDDDSQQPPRQHPHPHPHPHTLGQIEEQPLTVQHPNELAKPSSKNDDEDEMEEDETLYPSGVKLYIIMTALLVAEFLVGLDQTIIASATATVANQFDALSDIGWYGSAYLLCACCLQPLFGRLYTCFPKDRIFMIALILFEIGSIVSAVATSSRVFILGRALQGCGYAGIYIGELAISAAILPVRLQPIFTSLMNAFYGIGSVGGPLIGGALTTKVGWVWCFWINLPPGVAIIVVILLWVRPPYVSSKLTKLRRLSQMDWGGAALLLASTTCLLMALQEGGFTHPWSSARVIGLLVGFGALFVAFLALQLWLGERASVNLRLLSSRTGTFASLYSFSCGASYYSILYYVPIFFQAIQGASALGSGVRSIPLVITNSAAGILSGYAVTRGVPFNACMIVGGVFNAVGAGLLATMTESTGPGRWIGFQILAGVGMGTSYMQAFIATQVLFPLVDRATGASLVTFWQLWGATVWVSLSEAIYQGRLLVGIEAVPGLDVQAVLNSGVSEFRDVLEGNQLRAVIQVATGALLDVESGIAAVAAFGVCACLALRWKAVRKRK